MNGRSRILWRFDDIRFLIQADQQVALEVRRGQDAGNAVIQSGIRRYRQFTSVASIQGDAG